MSERLPRGVSGDQAIKALERKGWRVQRTKGSHYAMEHPDFDPTIVVPRHKELRPGTLNRILKTAEIGRHELCASSDRRAATDSAHQIVKSGKEHRAPDVDLRAVPHPSAPPWRSTPTAARAPGRPVRR